MGGVLRLFALGQRGVDVVNKPQDLDESELVSAQNAEIVSDGGEGALDQRTGMSRIPGSALGSILVAHDVASELLIEKTPYLMAGMYSGSAHNWRKTVDGATWTNEDGPAKPWSNDSDIVYFAKNWPKAVTIGKYLYFLDSASPIQLHRWDGTTDLVVGTVPPAVSGTNLATPGGLSVTFAGESLAAPVVTNANSTWQGTVGANTYQYKLVAVFPSGDHSAASVQITAVNCGTPGVDGHIAILVGAMNGASHVDVYRMSGGATTGVIGSITAAGAPGELSDTGQAGTGATPPASASDTRTTTYTYKIVAIQGALHSIAGVATSTLVGPTTLSTFDYNGLTISGSPVAGATSYDVYRTAGGATQGKIGSIGISAGILTFGNGSGLGFYNFSDGGLVADGSTAPTTVSGATTGEALAVLDVFTDGANLYLAVLDLVSGGSSGGRILLFSPVAQAWTQILAEFPITANKGTPGTLNLWDGAVNYGSYIGLDTGKACLVTTTKTPLPGGGVQEAHATSNNVLPLAMVGFGGALYVATGFITAGTAAIILKRLPPTGTWSTAQTGPATATLNAYTALGVFNGLLFAGWTSGGGLTAARIESTPDGVNWTLEYTADAAEVPCQMVTFLGALYVVMGRTGVAYNTKSRILKRTSGGVWSEVDNPSDDFAGCLGVVWV